MIKKYSIFCIIYFINKVKHKNSEKENYDKRDKCICYKGNLKEKELKHSLR